MKMEVRVGGRARVCTRVTGTITLVLGSSEVEKGKTFVLFAHFTFA